jgi:AcrR family transcriptional regulator
MLEAMQTARGREALKRIAEAYVRFGHDNPAEYRIMFGPEVAHTEDLPALRETARATLGFVAEGIAQLQHARLVGKGDPALMAVTTWSMLHGLVTLSLDGQTQGVAPVDAVVEEATRIMMFGMAGSMKRGR